jgi:hypothetical protein
MNVLVNAVQWEMQLAHSVVSSDRQEDNGLTFSQPPSRMPVLPRPRVQPGPYARARARAWRQPRLPAQVPCEDTSMLKKNLTSFAKGCIPTGIDYFVKAAMNSALSSLACFIIEINVPFANSG